MKYTFKNSSIVSVNSGTIVLNVSGKTRTFADAKLVSVVDREIVLNLPNVLRTNGAYITIHLACDGISQRTFISNINNDSGVTYHVTQYSHGIKFTGSWPIQSIYRKATPEEIKELNDQLAAEGKWWNPETMQIEKLRWKPKMGENYFTIVIHGTTSYILPYAYEDDSIDKHTYKTGNCFKTKEEAQAKLEQIKKIFLEV